MQVVSYKHFFIMDHFIFHKKTAITRSYGFHMTRGWGRQAGHAK